MVEHGAGARLTWWQMLRYDGPASLVVFLVALPLCIGVAIASGYPPEAGLITGIIGGLLVGCISGSSMQVSGPAAGLLVLVARVAQYEQDEGVQLLGAIVVLAGLMQLVAGVLRQAAWFRAVAPSVILGMIAGIGALILLSQLHVMMDRDPAASGLANIAKLPETFWHVIAPDETTVHHHAAFLGLLTIVIIIVWQSFLQKRLIVPGTLVAVLVAGSITFTFGWSQVRHVVVPDDFSQAFCLIRLESLSLIRDVDYGPFIWINALAVAVIASASSLLCATAMDRLHSGPRTQYNRELIAQGIGNILCGLVGGLPMSGVIVRSSVNVQAGARTRLSAILHGLWLLVMLWSFPHVMEYIPIACLAGILVYTGFKLIDLKAVRALWYIGKGEVLIYLATFAMIVAMDLLVGVLVGVALSAVKLLIAFARLRVRVEHDPALRRSTLYLTGAATFLRLPRLAAALESVPPGHELHVDCERLTYIDHACLDLLTNWAREYEAQGGRLVLDWENLHASFRKDSTHSVRSGFVHTNGTATPHVVAQPQEVDA